MWDRPMIKHNAKQELKHSYWLSFAVCLVATLLGAGGGGGGASAQVGSRNVSSNAGGYTGWIEENAGLLIAVGLVVFLIVVAFSLFVSNPVRVGQAAFFIRAPHNDRQFSNLFSSFKEGRYMSAVGGLFITDLVIFLWTLLFIIPGVIKSYQYRFVPYILSDDPSLSASEAMRLSRRMTDGEKFEMFVLDLSFIGWYLLGALALGVGTLFVNPYMEATWAQLYFILRQKASGSPGYGPAN